ncbi:MAG TPA: helix-turn-helix domain-containing protein [Acidimicrobiales bacterium]
MSWDHVLWAARRAGAPDPTAHHVLLVIATHTNTWGRAWPSLGTVAGEARLDRGTVRRAVRRIEIAGLVDVIHRRGRPCEFVFPQAGDLARSAAYLARSASKPRALCPPKELKELEGTPEPGHPTTWRPSGEQPDAGPVDVRALMANLKNQLKGDR